MKTLDEVIKAWSICFSDNSRSNCTGCPYADEDGESACFNHDREDALHYLKEYQGLSKMWNDRLDKEQKNDPLTWDELKGMEGKPVWVEERYRNGDLKSSGWWLIDFWNDDQICMRDPAGNPWNEHRSNYGRDWQAYRKERK